MPRYNARQSRPALELINLEKVYGHNVLACGDINLTILDREFVSLLGPSGCGKSTFCKLISGVEHPTRGRIILDGVDITHLPPHRRPIHMVWQHGALFPHLTVWKQIAYSLRVQGRSNSEIQDRCEWVIQRMKLTGLERRMPHELSGGQRQRVALGRALANENVRVLLLDEPLGQLDANLHAELRDFLAELHRDLKCSMIQVTHNYSDALSLSERVAIMRDGRLLQTAPPSVVYAHPTSRFVAEFVGQINFLGGRVTGNYFTTADGLRFPVQQANPSATLYGVRPEQVKVGPSADTVGTHFPCRIIDTSLRGPSADVKVKLNSGTQLLATVPVTQLESLVVGEDTAVGWNPAAVILVEG